MSFEVPSGAVYGVIGRNGAGKTTLLRCIAGILPPTAGRVAVWGHVTPLLSLGIGFNRELTGRENILLGGLTVGLAGDEVRVHEDEIEDFAGLGDAIDFPMRTYSSGMFGRLAFAVAVHLNPEILLIDEALSAGDASFKLKCMEKIQELCDAGLHRADRLPRARSGAAARASTASGWTAASSAWTPPRPKRSRRTSQKRTSRRRARRRSKTSRDASWRHPRIGARRRAHDVARRFAGRSYAISKRYAMWQMRGGGDRPIVVFTMGKTGSTAIAARSLPSDGSTCAFRSSGSTRPSSRARNSATSRRAASAKRGGDATSTGPFPGALHLWETEFLLRHMPTAEKPWNVITTVREPVAQAVSAFFHGGGRSGALQHGADVASLTERMLAEDWLRMPMRWFEREFLPTLGIDVFAQPFDPAAGFSLIETPAARVLLARQENLEGAPDALRGFLGLPAPVPIARRNEAGAKDYASAYRSFLREVRLPDAVLERAYATAYSRHFYSADELAAFRPRWSAE